MTEKIYTSYDKEIESTDFWEIYDYNAKAYTLNLKKIIKEIGKRKDVFDGWKFGGEIRISINTGDVFKYGLQMVTEEMQNEITKYAKRYHGLEVQRDNENYFLHIKLSEKAEN